MFFADLFILLVVFALILFAVTQVVYPMFSGEPLFPIFRRSAVRSKIVEAEHTLETVAEVAHLKKIVGEIESRTAEMGKKE